MCFGQDPKAYAKCSRSSRVHIFQTVNFFQNTKQILEREDLTTTHQGQARPCGSLPSLWCDETAARQRGCVGELAAFPPLSSQVQPLLSLLAHQLWSHNCISQLEMEGKLTQSFLCPSQLLGTIWSPGVAGYSGTADAPPGAYWSQSGAEKGKCGGKKHMRLLHSLSSLLPIPSCLSSPFYSTAYW